MESSISSAKQRTATATRAAERAFCADRFKRASDIAPTANVTGISAPTVTAKP
jgi:hypothetical protein